MRRHRAGMRSGETCLHSTRLSHQKPRSAAHWRWTTSPVGAVAAARLPGGRPGRRRGDAASTRSCRSRPAPPPTSSADPGRKAGRAGGSGARPRIRPPCARRRTPWAHPSRWWASRRAGAPVSRADCRGVLELPPPAEESTPATGAEQPDRHRVAFGEIALIAPPITLDGEPPRWAHGPPTTRQRRGQPAPITSPPRPHSSVAPSADPLAPSLAPHSRVLHSIRLPSA